MVMRETRYALARLHAFFTSNPFVFYFFFAKQYAVSDE
jgi:hypothetical protein